MNITVEQTLEMPNAVLFVRKVKAALKAEREKRRHFYEIVEENKMGLSTAKYFSFDFDAA